MTRNTRLAIAGHAAIFAVMIGVLATVRAVSPPHEPERTLPPTDRAADLPGATPGPRDGQGRAASYPVPALAVHLPPPEPALTMPPTDVRIGTALASRRGTATWCAPTRTHCHGWGGDAHLGAVRSFTWRDKPYSVTVCVVATGSCTRVVVVSYCECPHTLIDLSPAAFRELAPLTAGRVGVVVTREWVPEPPATDR